MNKIVELLIDWENLEFDDLGVEVMSIVDSPAIGIDFLAFSEEEDENQEAMEEAILKLAEQYGETVDYENSVFIDGTKSNFENVGDYLKGIVGLDILGKQDADKEPEIKFRYTGPITSNSRNFCKAMVRLNKLYTRDEIRDMDSSINTGFRHNGSPYSLFDFKGGVNCRHYWEEVEVYKEGRQTVVMSKGRANGRSWTNC